MTLDLEHFTPVRAALGGTLIGLSAAWLLLAHGRIAGISGLLGQVVRQVAEPAAGRTADLRITVAFLAGLMIAPLLFVLLGQPATSQISATTGTLVIAGVLVGLGTRYAGGCTSGHGVCGLSNLSSRSLVATLLFMASAMLTVGLQRWLA
jgi:uncharacterized membrane protein YedE/YeeE